MNKPAKQYLQKVNKQIHCASSAKRTFLRQLKNEVLCFCDDHDNVDAAMLAENFGSPKEVAEAFFSELGTLAANHYMFARRKLLLMTLGIILVTVLLILAIDIRTDFLKEQLLKNKPTASVIYEGDSEEEIFSLPDWYHIFEEKEDKSAAPTEGK